MNVSCKPVVLQNILFHNMRHFFLKRAENSAIYFYVWLAHRIAPNAENHIFEILDFQIFQRKIAPPLPQCV